MSLRVRRLIARDTEVLSRQTRTRAHTATPGVQRRSTQARSQMPGGQDLHHSPTATRRPGAVRAARPHWAWYWFIQQLRASVEQVMEGRA